MRYRLCLLYIILGLSHHSLAVAQDDGAFNLHKIAEGVYLHYGRHVAIDHQAGGDIANIGFIIGNQCIAVIDTGGSVTVGDQLRQQIRSLSAKPICYVINTHIHFDHVLGNSAFRSEGPVFVGHHKLAAAIEQNRDFFLSQFKDKLGESPKKEQIIGPDLLVDAAYQLDLGNRILDLIPFPAAHSHSDLIVIDRKTQTLWSGDLIFRERTPVLAGSLKGWLAAMDVLRTLAAKTVIPGHGHTAPSLPLALQQQTAYLERLIKETRQAIAEGKFINEASEQIDRENLSGWLLFHEQHPANVRKAFTELEWE